jgi:hypothetical protein
MGLVQFGRPIDLILSHSFRSVEVVDQTDFQGLPTFNSYPNVTANWYESFSNIPFLSDVCVALLSVYDKSGLLELAQGLHDAGVRLLGSGGTAKKIREAGIPIG